MPSYAQVELASEKEKPSAGLPGECDVAKCVSRNNSDVCMDTAGDDRAQEWATLVLATAVVVPYRTLVRYPSPSTHSSGHPPTDTPLLRLWLESACVCVCVYVQEKKGGLSFAARSLARSPSAQTRPSCVARVRAQLCR